MEVDQRTDAKAGIKQARDAYIDALQGAQSPQHISDAVARERATLAKEQYLQATKALVRLILEAAA